MIGKIFLQPVMKRSRNLKSLNSSCHLEMEHAVLKDIFGRLTSSVTELDELFQRLDRLENCFFFVSHQDSHRPRYVHVSHSVEALTGYPVKSFLKENGPGFVYSIIPPDYRKILLDHDAHLAIRLRNQTSHSMKPLLLEVDAALRHRDSHVMNARLMAVTLELTEKLSPLLAVNVWQIVDSMSDDEYLTSKLSVEQLLTQIYRCFQSYCPYKNKLHFDEGQPVHLSYPFYGYEELSKREYLVLKLIADGLSSHEIADKLSMSFHTAESHRKNLLQKFQAHNSAELVKKATKVFWLE